MGILDSLFGDGSSGVKEFPGGVKSTSKQTEAAFRKSLEGSLQEQLEVLPKSGKGVRADLHFVFKEIDYLIVIRKGLTEQKLKATLGELVLLGVDWVPEGSDGKTYVFVVVIGELTAKDRGWWDPLVKGIEHLKRDNFHIEAIPCGTK